MAGDSHRNITFDTTAAELPNTDNYEVLIVQWYQAPRTRGSQQNQAGNSLSPEDSDIPPPPPFPAPQLTLMMLLEMTATVQAMTETLKDDGQCHLIL